MHSSELGTIKWQVQQRRRGDGVLTTGSFVGIELIGGYPLLSPAASRQKHHPVRCDTWKTHIHGLLFPLNLGNSASLCIFHLKS